MTPGAVLTQGRRLRSGRYELQRKLGAGAHAAVWLARDTVLQRPVAVKLLAEGLVEDREWLARFRREARTAARLQHPNLVSVFDFNAEVERPYLVMAYMPGGSLLEYLNEGGRPHSDRLAVDLLSALAHIHAAGVVHRDVKPGNVLFDADGRACLTDFGIARPQDATSITQTGQIPGTAHYMAPELWRGEPASPRSDLYSTGVVLRECLDDDAPARVIGLAERLTAENPELRPASAEAALGLLGERAAIALVPAPQQPAVPDGPPPDGPPTDPGPAPTGPTERRAEGAPVDMNRGRWLSVAAVAVVALLTGFAVAGGLGGDDEFPPEPQTRAERDRTDQPERGGAGERETGGTAGASGAEEDAPPTEPNDAAVDPVALNDQGYALIQQGRYDEAIPLLQQAVEGLEGSGDINYAYALYNLGHALRLAGRPAEAIPILEARLEIPNQTEVVKAELDRAKEDLKAQEEAAKEAEKEDG